MRSEGDGERLMVYLSETDHFHHHPVYTELVQRARAAGLAGATVVQAVAGFGATGHARRQHSLHLTEDVPVVVVIVDTPERIQAFLPTVDELVQGGLAVRRPVRMITYRDQTFR